MPILSYVLKNEVIWPPHTRSWGILFQVHRDPYRWRHLEGRPGLPDRDDAEVQRRPNLPGIHTI